jgi:hypothetical protein
MSSPEHAAVPRWLPSPLVLVLIAMAGILAMITLARGLTDADYFWHFTTGQLIVESGSVPTVDPFSFTYAGQPWTPHEWLGEVLIYLFVTKLGSTLTLIGLGLLAAASVAIPAVTARRLGAGTMAISVASAICALVAIPYLAMRPQAASWVLLALLSLFLLSLDARRPRRALWLVPLFIFWANLHLLYVVGLGVVALYTLFTLVRQTSMADARRWMVGSAVGALLASTVTPAGVAGLLYPLRDLEPGDWGLANIAEWQSPNFHDPANLGFLLIVLALAAVGGRARSVPFWMRTLSWLGVAMTLLSLRHAPVAAVWALPVIATGLPHWGLKPAPASQRLARRIIEVGIALVVLVAAAIIILPTVEPPRQTLERAGMPVAALDELAAIQPDARVFAEYGWGGYVIYRLHDEGGRVFVDGRNDMYPQSILQDYSDVRMAGVGWQATLARYGVNALLLTPDTPLARVASQAGWCEKLRDDHAVLLTRCGD